MSEAVPLGSVVATRELEFVHAGGQSEAVLVSVGMPVQGDDPEFWRCPYRILGTSFQRDHHTAGIDAVQALDLALVTVSAELSFIAKQNSGVFHFLGEPGHEFRSS